VFVRTELAGRYKISETNGVIGFIEIGEKPSWIPEEQIEWPRQIIGMSEYVRRER
jgi:hypothetical protein